jgi:DNA replication protein DnaC
LWRLGKVPERHRTDRLSTAVNNMSDPAEFTERYQGLMRFYGLEGEKTQANHGNENGDVEQRHHRFKRAVAQELMLRGSVDFASVETYKSFLEAMFVRLNAGRSERLAEELAVMRELPERRMESSRRERVKVDSGSLIHVDRNAYSVPSRLIGEQVEARLFMDHVEVWYGQKKVAEMPRLRGRQKHRVDYRHIIDWLVRKPGAFEHYRYRGELFPTTYDLRSAGGAAWLVSGQQGVFEDTGVGGERKRGRSRRCVACAAGGRRRTDPCRQDRGHAWSRPQHDGSRCAGGSGGSERLRPVVQCAGGAAMSSAPQIRTELLENLKELHLPAMRECFEETAQQAEKETLSYEQYLLQLTERECESRRRNRIAVLLRESGLPREKTMANFDRKRLPLKAARQLKALVEGSFLDRKENLLVFGNPGAGKSHLVCALAHELIAQGRRMKYTSCSLLVQDLLVAKRDLRLSKEIKKLARHDGLIIDEMDYVQQSREEMEVLFTLLSERYERGSVLLTSNLPFSKWEGIFKDPMTTAAAIDRLVHHSVIVELNIPSYRMDQARKTRDPASESSEAN